MKLKSSCYIIKLINDAIKKEANMMLAEMDLTMTQAGVLLLLSQKNDGKMSLKELERLVNVSQPTIAGISSRMQQKGLVEIVESSEDKRAKIMKLMPQGEECCKIAKNQMKSAEEKLLSPLSQDEVKELNRLLQKLAEPLDKGSC